jgi:putative transport protein
VIEILADNPLLLLFIVAALGYPLGRIRVAGFNLGVAAVLFVGLGMGAIDPSLRLPDLVYQLGLVIFVYTVGLASGPGFFASFGRRGLRDNLLVLAALLFAAGLTTVLALGLKIPGPFAAGLFAGGLTNTPALASLVETLQQSGRAALDNQPVVAYSISYPVGVVGVILAIFIAQRLWHVDYPGEARALRDLGASGEHLDVATVRITRADMAERNVQGWLERERWHVLFARYRRGDELDLVHGDTVLRPGDDVTLVGANEDLRDVVPALGEPSPEHLEFDRTRLDVRRIFVSDPEVAGKALRELGLLERFGALVTRVRRGDSDLLPSGGMRLELGDRVRVVTRRDRMEAVGHYFGDSYRSLSEIDVLPFGLGIALGLALGLVPWPLPGGLTFRLGFAGGPLVVALAVSALRRTGPILWQPPYSANLTLRQLGLVLFLAGIGTRSGHAFATTLAAGGGLRLFLGGALITCASSLLTLVLGSRLLRIPMSLLIGMLSGQQTQPAVLGFANEQTGNDLPNVGYATVFPLATIAKILLAQVLLLALPH